MPLHNCTVRRSSDFLFRPNRVPVCFMNCQGPAAPLGERAYWLRSLSATARYLRSSGRLWLLSLSSIKGKYFLLLFIQRMTWASLLRESRNCLSRRSQTSLLSKGTCSPQNSRLRGSLNCSRGILKSSWTVVRSSFQSVLCKGPGRNEKKDHKGKIYADSLCVYFISIHFV